MIKEITEGEFKEKIARGDGDFTHRIFDFAFEFSDYLESDNTVNFKIDFSSSIFRNNISFSQVSFKKHFAFARCQTYGITNFYLTHFYRDVLFRRSEFFKKANFNVSWFQSDVDFNRSIFHDAAHFKKSRFERNLFMSRAIFCKKIDFSYAHFSNDYYTSFTSINSESTPCGKNPGYPFFIFRNIFFPSKTVFNEVALERVVFQDCIIDKIIFKGCSFSQKKGRDVFYTEISKRRSIEICNGAKDFAKKKVNTLVLPNTSEVADLNIGDILEICFAEEQVKDKFFIVTRFEASTSQELKELLVETNLRKMYSGFNEIVCHNCVIEEELETGVVGFRLKKFSEKKHWSVLEDNNRQMKKSLEETRDWQGSGNFYRGEMKAKVRVLAEKGEQFWYRQSLAFYQIISKFGESTNRIFMTMLITFVFGTGFLIYAKPDSTFFDILALNIEFFFPIFGSNAVTIKSLNLDAWQQVVVEIEIIWFYFLWLIMLIAARRRFRR